MSGEKRFFVFLWCLMALYNYFHDWICTRSGVTWLGLFSEKRHINVSKVCKLYCFESNLQNERLLCLPSDTPHCV